MYHIISFFDSEEVEVVPAIWVKNGVCLWPPYKGEGTLRAIKCLEQPQESWSAYKVRIMYTANNYSEACQKLPLAEQQTNLQSEAEPDTMRPPKYKIKQNRRLLDDYDTDEETTTPISKRIFSASNNLQPSPLRQRQNPPPLMHQKSTDMAQIAETSRSSLLEIGPVSEWHEKTPGSSLRQAIDMPELNLPRQQISQQSWQARRSARTSQDITDHNTEYTWHQDTTLPFPEQAAQSPWNHETPRPQRKSLSSYDPFITSLLHDIITKQEILMEQQKNIIRMVQDLKGRFVHHATRSFHSTLCGSRHAWERE